MQIYYIEKYNIYKVNIDKKENIHNYMGLPLVELLFYNDNIYIAFSFGDDCLISEDGISAIFLDNKLLSLDTTDSETNLYNNIIYKLEGN